MENERLARVEEQMRWMTQDVSEIKQDVKTLLSFKWRFGSAMAVILFLIETAFRLIEIARAKGF